MGYKFDDGLPALKHLSRGLLALLNDLYIFYITLYDITVHKQRVDYE
jgi:hypothetical protein